MTTSPPQHRQNLSVRARNFAKRVRQWAKKLPEPIGESEDVWHAIRSSGEIGAYYIGANEAVSKKQSQWKLHLCKKEAQESAYWLELLDIGLPSGAEKERQALKKEAYELKLIFNAIITKYYKVSGVTEEQK